MNQDNLGGEGQREAQDQGARILGGAHAFRPGDGAEHRPVSGIGGERFAEDVRPGADDDPEGYDDQGSDVDEFDDGDVAPEGHDPHGDYEDEFDDEFHDEFHDEDDDEEPAYGLGGDAAEADTDLPPRRRDEDDPHDAPPPGRRESGGHPVLAGQGGRGRAIGLLAALGLLLLVAFSAAFAAVHNRLSEQMAQPAPTAATGTVVAGPGVPPPGATSGATTGTGTAGPSGGSSTGSTAACADVSGTTVNVYNATQTDGLAGKVAKELTTQGFTVGATSNDPTQKKVDGVGEVRFGDAGKDKAQALAARFPGATMVNDARSEATVDIAVGPGFTSVATPACAH